MLEEFMVDGKPELRPYTLQYQRSFGRPSPQLPVYVPELKDGEELVHCVGESKPIIIKMRS